MQMVLGVAVELDLSRPWHRSGPMFGDPRLAPTGSGSRRSRQWWRMPTSGAAPSPGRRSARPCRRRTSCRSSPPTAASTASTTACCSAPTCTLCSTTLRRRRPGLPAPGQPPAAQRLSNGDSFYAKAGEVIALPERRTDRPNPDFLRWHLENIFKASSRQDAGMMLDRLPASIIVSFCTRMASPSIWFGWPMCSWLIWWRRRG